jgi:predicted HAD superfamily Cof-like phosphohydrolase
MTTTFEGVKEWHEIFAQWQIARGPVGLLPLSLIQLRISLMREELDELEAAMYNGDLIEIADGIGDLLFTTYGTALAFGINADAVSREILRSNMSKAAEDGTPILREDGKVMKGPNYSPPDLQFVLGNKP